MQSHYYGQFHSHSQTGAESMHRIPKRFWGARMVRMSFITMPSSARATDEKLGVCFCPLCFCNSEVCEREIAIKPFELRSDFVAYEQICSCASAFNFVSMMQAPP